MNAKINVGGNIGTAVNAETGSQVTIHLPDEKKATLEQQNQVISDLLTACDALGSRKALTRISKKLFGSSNYKSLSIHDLNSLLFIAHEMVAVIQVQLSEPPSLLKNIACPIPVFNKK